VNELNLVLVGFGQNNNAKEPFGDAEILEQIEIAAGEFVGNVTIELAAAFYFVGVI